MEPASSYQRILLTGARSPVALEFARLLNKAGHTVFASDTTKWTCCSYSKHVAKSFIFPSPRFKDDEFISSLVEIVEKEQIDFILPITEEIFYIAKHRERLSKLTTILCESLDLLHILHNKWSFIQKLDELGFCTPRTLLIEKEEDLENIHFTTPYVLKACYSRASQNIIRCDPKNEKRKKPEIKKSPWVAQEWIEGKKYCSYAITHNGKLSALATYPVKFAIDNSSCLTFEPIRHAKVEAWIEDFISQIGFTGQIAFDFIEDSSGSLYAIECNPRGTSGLHLFTPENHIDRALFDQNSSVIYPPVNTFKQILAGMLLYGWRTKKMNLRFFRCYSKKLFSYHDVVFSLNDIRPFLSMGLLVMIYMYWSIKYNLRLPAAFTYDLDWNGDSLST